MVCRMSASRSAKYETASRSRTVVSGMLIADYHRLSGAPGPQPLSVAQAATPTPGFEKPGEFQTASLDRLDGLLRRHAQFGVWSARFPQDRRFFARARVPVDDGKASAELERFPHGARQSRAIGNAVKGIRHEDKVSRTWREPGNLVSITFDKTAVRHATFGKTMPRHFEQVAIDVDGHNATRAFCDLQREPTVGRHLRALEEARKTVAHGEIRPFAQASLAFGGEVHRPRHLA